jgi:REP element-mobilizing transposase RayT
MPRRARMYISGYTYHIVQRGKKNQGVRLTAVPQKQIEERLKSHGVVTMDVRPNTVKQGRFKP